MYIYVYIMGLFKSRETIVTVPDKGVMLHIVDRIVSIEEKLKRGENLTRAQELEQKELEKVVKSMKQAQKYLSRVGTLTISVTST